MSYLVKQLRRWDQPGESAARVTREAADRIEQLEALIRDYAIPALEAYSNGASYAITKLRGEIK